MVDRSVEAVSLDAAPLTGGPPAATIGAERLPEGAIMSELPRFTDVTLMLTEQCNLRCPYCYVPKTERHMSEELALRAADFLLDRAPAGAGASLSFFGGEPLLERSLIERVVAHGLTRRPAGLRFTMPTNGLLLDGEALELVRVTGTQLALSLDSTEPGVDKGAASLERLQPLLPDLRRLNPIVRLTVTPDNVDRLCEGIISLFSLGLQRIMHQPAIERRWPTAALESWRAQHQRLADWACDRYQQRLLLPELMTLEGIVGRLGGRPARSCGAGVTTAAISVDGEIFGCYRSVYDPHPERMALGDLLGGQVNETLIAAYAQLDPARARPERGSCRECEARQGCTCYCPAMGHALLGDLRAVSADACALMRVQVEVCRDIVERTRRIERTRRRSVSAHVAAAALAIGLASTTAACDSARPAVLPDAAVDRGPDQGPPPGLCFWRDGRVDQMTPGLCHPDLTVKHDQMTPGLCAQPKDMLGPGICVVQPDLLIKKDGQIGPGLCPVKIDLAPAKPEISIGPGLCPVKIDGPVPGIC
jgi:uncharacterized protein